jgi:hypothetical protein
MASQASEPEVAAQANRISRDYDVLRANYEKLLQDREALRTRGKVEDKASQFRFDVIQEPGVSQKPAAPNRPLLLIGVLLVGLGAGAGTAYAMGQVKSSFATPQKLERAFDLPVIGAISLRTGHSLAWDGAAEKFVGAHAAEANRNVRREMRAPYDYRFVA